MNRASRFVNKISDLPSGPHYAIIRQTSVHIPGDERSRTNPGHGYPESTEYFIQYEAFDKRSDWEEEIAQLTARREMFKVVQVYPGTVTASISVDVT